MSFQTLEGHASLFSATAVSQKQFDITKKMIAHNGGESKIQGKILHIIAQECLGTKYVPYFIGKNVALRVKGTSGLFDLSRLKVAKSKPAAKPVSTEVAVTNKPKSNRKGKKPTPVVTIDETKLIEAPATEPESIESALEAL